MADLLRNVYRETMPDAEHHTAAPALWYLWQQCPTRPLEVSFVPLTGVTSQEREGLESLAIALERQKYQSSPVAMYGRMPAGLVKPPRNTRTGKHLKTPSPSRGSDESIAPVADLFRLQHQDPLSSFWGGHFWTEWKPIAHLPKEKAQGIYRLHKKNTPRLFVIGHGKIASAAHYASKNDETLLYSYVPDTWTKGQRRELCDDALALYLLARAKLPDAQFRSLQATRDPHNPVAAFPARAASLLVELHDLFSLPWMQRNLPAAS